MTSAAINTVRARVINTQESLLIFPTEVSGKFQTFSGLVGETLPGANGEVIFVPQNPPAPTTSPTPTTPTPTPTTVTPTTPPTPTTSPTTPPTPTPSSLRVFASLREACPCPVRPRSS